MQWPPFLGALLLCVAAAASAAFPGPAPAPGPAANAPQKGPTPDEAWAAVIAAALLASNNGSAPLAQAELQSVAAYSVQALAADAKTVPSGASFMQHLLATRAASLGAQAAKAFHAEDEEGQQQRRAKPQLTDIVTKSIPQILEESGSGESFRELVANIADPTSLLDFDPDMFKTALAGVGVEANLVSFAPCLVRNSAAGVGVEANMFSIIPQLIKGIEPNGVNVEPTLINVEPKLIQVAPQGVGVEAVGIAIGNSLIRVAPVGRADSFIFCCMGWPPFC